LSPKGGSAVVALLHADFHGFAGGRVVRRDSLRQKGQGIVGEEAAAEAKRQKVPARLDSR
jgi:hypothetical protein